MNQEAAAEPACAAVVCLSKRVSHVHSSSLIYLKRAERPDPQLWDAEKC